MNNSPIRSGYQGRLPRKASQIPAKLSKLAGATFGPRAEGGVDETTGFNEGATHAPFQPRHLQPKLPKLAKTHVVSAPRRKAPTARQRRTLRAPAAASASGDDGGGGDGRPRRANTRVSFPD